MWEFVQRVAKAQKKFNFRWQVYANDVMNFPGRNSWYKGVHTASGRAREGGAGDQKGTLLFLNSAKDSNFCLAAEGKPNQRLCLFPVIARATSKVYVETCVESNLQFRRQPGRSNDKEVLRWRL